MTKKDEKAIQVPEQEIIEKEDMERTRERQCFIPKTDIYETDAGIVVIADIPGVDQKNVDISLDKNILTLNAFADVDLPQGFNLQYGEYEPGDFQRTFRITDEIDKDKIEAKVTNGVLQIRLPKAETSKAMKIPVSAG
jgi:HSP20 family protein